MTTKITIGGEVKKNQSASLESKSYEVPRNGIMNKDMILRWKL